MNGPTDRVDFQTMGPRHGGSFWPMGFAFDDGFRPMGPNEGTRSIVGAGGGGGGFRHSGPVKFPQSGSPNGGRLIGKVMEPDYSVRPTPPPGQQPLSGQKRGHPLSEHDSFSGTDLSDRSSIVKLFVGSVPRTAIEEEVRPFFEQHGNVLEVALIKDKRTGQQQGHLKRLMGSNLSLIIGLHMFATIFGLIAYACERLICVRFCHRRRLPV